MADKGKQFENALNQKKIAVLTIDKKYLDLVAAVGGNDHMKSLEASLNELLKEQGKGNNEIKDIKKLKAKLMQEIVENADSDINDKAKEKKADENSRLIKECNEKIETWEDRLLDIPKEIDAVNKELMLELMENCYDVMKANEADIEETAKWITQIRIELKKRLVKKQDMEMKNQQIYAYMHDIFGAEVIEIFDMKYKEQGKQG